MKLYIPKVKVRDEKIEEKAICDIDNVADKGFLKTALLELSGLDILDKLAEEIMNNYLKEVKYV